MPVELVFGIDYFLFVGYFEYCAFIRVEFHAPFIFPMSQLMASRSQTNYNGTSTSIILPAKEIKLLAFCVGT
jgi:hypothetical protein